MSGVVTFENRLHAIRQHCLATVSVDAIIAGTWFAKVIKHPVWQRKLNTPPSPAFPDLGALKDPALFANLKARLP